jgi:hypothetical protein
MNSKRDARHMKYTFVCVLAAIGIALCCTIPLLHNFVRCFGTAVTDLDQIAGLESRWIENSDGQARRHNPDLECQNRAIIANLAAWWCWPGAFGSMASAEPQISQWWP